MKSNLIRIALMIMMTGLFFTACGSNNTPAGTGGTKMYITDITADEYYNNGYTYNSIVGIDQFERTLMPTSVAREGEHEVGIFYFLCMGGHDSGAIYDNSKILAMENGVELLTQTDNQYSRANGQHWWGEPLYGYYSSSDEWVIRRHLELLAHAGIDFLVFDVSNAVTYDMAYMRTMKAIDELRSEGFDVPQCAFYTNSASPDVITKLYKATYAKEKYKNAWYYMDGKPLIIGKDIAALDSEIADFFTIRDSQWPNEPFIENGFPWMEWTYPAPVHNGIINVCVAAHPALPMSYSLTHGAQNWGRGWDVEKQENISEDVDKGTYFQSTWDVALKEDPRMIFVTGWNEWTVGKTYDPGYGEYIFVDCVNKEFSRDAEIMKGGYNDAFYIQTAINSRNYKSQIISANSCFESTHVNGADILWDNVKAVFRDIGDFNKARKNSGSTSAIKYEQEPARNNVVEIKVCEDAQNIYFRLVSTDNISTYEAGDTKWMNLFIGTGNVSAKGWESYEYVINREVDTAAGIGSIEKLNADFTGEKLAETASFVIDGNTMVITVPKSAVGLTENNIFYFKFADNITYANDIMDYYVSGKSLPMGRLSYQYLGG